ncbi:uncharacterized protein IUM83_10537 [Phytophthora cinnamomi]|uniref:uncharacterized protein n=1 Tax=Phytophthora cinnamomi TaxID=4785 RepID=UPI00355A4625|nr:hypothetical protein IUM83_10537 [Phytophthora cinnamomi]
MVAVTCGMASDELESAEPERGAMAPPELPVGPESDSAVPELLCAVVDSDDELEADAESAVTDASVAADLDVADVELAELELDSATAALALVEDATDDAVAVAALALDDVTFEDVEAAVVAVVVVVVVAPDTADTAKAARTSTWKAFMTVVGYLTERIDELFETEAELGDSVVMQSPVRLEGEESRESSEQLSPDAEEYKMPNLGPRSVDRI